MEIVNFANHQQIAGRGVCPHCFTNSYFKPVAIAHEDAHQRGDSASRMIAACQCEACKKFVLLTGVRNSASHAYNLEFSYPSATPRDSVSECVPKNVAEDIAEALRCHWIESHKAAVVMCRRAIQASALALGAKGGRLIDQIDSLFAAGKITEPLRDFAHEIRLTGNDGAHPDKDGLSEVKKDDAKAILEFTHEFLHHVYVMPAKLKARQVKPATAATSEAAAPISKAPPPISPIK